MRNSPERLGNNPSAVEKSEKKQEDSRELKEASKEFVEGVAEVVEGAEAAEMGEVAEKAGEDRKKGPQGQFPKAGDNGKSQKVQIKPIVLPRIEVMQIQVATAIHKEIAMLEKEAVRVADNPFALVGVVSKIRELKNILADLTHLTFEKLKSLWMSLVKKSS